MNLVKIGNHITDYTTISAFAGAIGYGITRAFTTLDPIAGATFGSAYFLAGAFVDPIFNNEVTSRNSLGAKDYTQSTRSSRILGLISKIALAYLATAKLTPFVQPTINAIATEILSTKSLITTSISLPAFSLPVVGIVSAVTILALGLLIKGIKREHREE